MGVNELQNNDNARSFHRRNVQQVYGILPGDFNVIEPFVNEMIKIFVSTSAAKPFPSGFIYLFIYSIIPGLL
jgi:hypothetical protein